MTPPLQCGVPHAIVTGAHLHAALPSNLAQKANGLPGYTRGNNPVCVVEQVEFDGNIETRLHIGDRFSCLSDRHDLLDKLGQ
jgi:hypothetical protein